MKDVRPHIEALWERSWTAAVSYVARKFTKVNRDLAFLGGLCTASASCSSLRAAHYPFVLRDRTKYGAILRRWHAPFAKGLTGWKLNPRSSKRCAVRTSIVKW